MSIFLALVATGQLFAFQTQVDRLTDEEIPYVTAGDAARGPGLIIQCGSSSFARYVITILPGRTLPRPELLSSAATFRFDDQPAFTVPATYENSRVVIEFDYAQRVVEGLQSSESMLVAVNASSERIDLDFPTEGAAAAVAQLAPRCGHATRR